VKLTPLEQERAEKFLKRLDVQLLTYHDSGQWAYVFGPSNGIGVPVAITARSPVTGEVISEDITDVESW
jgi:hypothetical protein